MHRTFLLTWHPKRWRCTELQEALGDLASAGVVHDEWSVGNRTDLPVGSRLFLTRLGEDPKGLGVSGWSTSEPRKGPHWDPDRAAAGDLSPRVQMDFDVLREAAVLALEELRSPPFSSMTWTPQASGNEIPTALATALEERWGQTLPGLNVAPLTDTPVPTRIFPGGGAAPNCCQLIRA